DRQRFSSCTIGLSISTTPSSEREVGFASRFFDRAGPSTGPSPPGGSTLRGKGNVSSLSAGGMGGAGGTDGVEPGVEPRGTGGGGGSGSRSSGVSGGT